MILIDVLSPADGSLAGRVRQSSPTEVTELVAVARAAQPAWAARAPHERAEVLRALRRWLAEHADELVATVCAETGKTWEDAALAELGYCLEALRHWSLRGPALLGERRGRAWRSAAALGRRTTVRRAARGVVGVITPWNYPLALAVGDLAPALLAGNAVVLKPSEATPLTAELVERGLLASGLPAGVLALAHGGGTVGEAVVDHVDMVMFTGSTATGRQVAAQAGRRLIPATLELGGKDAMIVCAGADLRRAARAAAFYGLQNAGQICMAIERVYVESAVHDAFVGHLVREVQALRQGSGGPGAAEVGALTTAAQLQIVERHVADAVQRGAEVRAGGRRRPGPGRFYEPTVLTGVDHSMACMTEETFGPTLPVMAVADVDEAVRLVNDSPYGLSASVFAADPLSGERIARRLEVGSVVVDDALIFFGALDLPMGGWKASGVGVRHGAEGLLKYTRPQAIVVGRTWPRRDPHWFPYRRTSSQAVLAALRLSARRL